MTISTRAAATAVNHRSEAHTPGVTTAGRRQTWALAGVPAALLGFAALLIPVIANDGVDSADGVAVIDQLSRGAYHAAIILGLAAALCVLVTAAGWGRWAAASAPDSLAGRLVSLGFTASAGAMLLGYGFMGSLAVYLPGGADDGIHPAEGLYAVYMFLDFAPFIAWWGAAFAACGIAWLSLRERALPLWMGIVSALFVLMPVAFMAATGLPGFPGVVDPAWLLIISVGMALRRDR